MGKQPTVTDLMRSAISELSEAARRLHDLARLQDEHKRTSTDAEADWLSSLSAAIENSLARLLSTAQRWPLDQAQSVMRRPQD